MSALDLCVEEERLAARQGCPDDLENETVIIETRGVPRRITLQGSVPGDLPAGAVVEIDLLGTGLPGYYARLLIDPPSSDADGVLVAAEILERCVTELEESRSLARAPADKPYWVAFVRRLSLAEMLISDYVSACTGALVRLVDHARAQLLLALRDDIRYSAETWVHFAGNLDLALERCNALAEQAKVTILERHERFESITYVPLDTAPQTVSNPEQLAEGLDLASHLGLDHSTIEVGHCYGGEVIAAIRGHKL